TAEPPPEHAERVARLTDMASEIEHYVQTREDLHERFNGLPPVTDEETEQQRNYLRISLTRTERSLEQRLHSRIELIDEATAALEATLPGYTPALPPQPTSSPAASPTPAEENQNDSGYTVQGEIAWLGEERDKDAAL